MLPARAGDRRLALGVVLLSLAFFLALALFAKVPLTPVPAFLPFYQSAMIVTDALTVAGCFSARRASQDEGRQAARAWSSTTRRT